MSKVKFFAVFMVAILLISGSAFAAGEKCMFIASTDPLTEGDQAVFDLLGTWGYVCTAVLSSDLGFFVEADYADYDFIFASESVGSSSLAPIKLVPKPLLNSEGWASKPASLAWADPASAENLAPEPCVIVDNTGHALAAGMAEGTVFDLCSDAAALIVACIPTVDIIPVAALESDPTKMVVYGVDAGTVLTDGDISGNKAASVQVHEFGYLFLTDEAIDLYQAGIQWILKAPVDPVDPGTGEGNGETCMFIASTDPLTEGDQYMFDALTAWGYVPTAVLSSDLGFFVEADYADYDFIFASESVGSSSLAPIKLVPKPLLNSEGWASKPASLAWADPASAENLAPEPCVIVDNTGHALAAGMAEGTVFDLCSDAAALIVACIPTVDIIPVAALESDPTKMVVYGVDAGTVLTDGDISGNKAASVQVHEFGYLFLTDEAIDLYKAGIQWILPTSAVENVATASPANFILRQNYPNPFNPTTQISYSIANQSKVTLSVFNLTGQNVATLVDSDQNAGEYSVTFDAHGLNSGVYFYQLQADGQLITQKMLLTKQFLVIM